MSEPRVTIAIPNQNKAAFIRQAVESVLNQTYEDIRIIVLDNASTDGSVEQIKDLLSDSRLEIVENEKNIGPFENFKKGEMMAKSEYFKFLCSDDYLHPDFVKHAVEMMDANPTAGIYACKPMFIDENNEKLGIGTNPWTGSALYKGNEVIHLFMKMAYNFIGTPTNVFYRKCFFPNGEGSTLYGKSYRVAGDTATYIRVLQKSDFYCTDSALCYYRQHKDCYSSRPIAPMEWTLDHSDILRSLLENGYYLKDPEDRMAASCNIMMTLGAQLLSPPLMRDNPNLAKRITEAAFFWSQGLDGSDIYNDFRYHALIEKARNYESMGKFDKALTIYKAIFENDNSLKFLSLDIKRVSSKIISLSENHDKKTLDEMIQKGRDLFCEGKLDEALSVFKYVLNNNSEDASVYNDAACILWKKGNHKDALDEIKKAVDLNPSDKNILLNCSGMYIASGLKEEAETILKNYIENNPQDIEIMNEYQKIIKDHSSPP